MAAIAIRRRRRGARVTVRAMLFATTALCAIIPATPAKSDPFTLATIAVTAISVAGTVIGGTLGAILVITAAIGGFLAQQYLAEPPNVAGQKELRTRQFNSHPPFTFAYGACPLEGDVVFKEVVDDDLYVILKFSDGFCTRNIHWIEINDGERLEILADANNDIFDMLKGARIGDTNKMYNGGTMRVWWGDGWQTQFPQEWHDINIGPLLKQTDTWHGSCCLFIKWDYEDEEKAAERWPLGAPPPIRVMADWTLCYDPRKDSTVSDIVPGAAGTHRFEDPTTWEHTHNPALHKLHFDTHDKGMSIPTTRILLQMYAEAADACDAQDGGVGERNLWTSVMAEGVNVLASGAYPESNKVYYNRGTVTAGVDFYTLDGTNTNGVTSNDQTARMGMFIDILKEGLDPAKTYKFRESGVLTMTIGSSVGRYRLYKADKGNGSVNPSAADNFLPADAANIVLLADSGYVNDWAAVSPAIRTQTFSGAYFSVVIEQATASGGTSIAYPQGFHATSQEALVRFQSNGVVVSNKRQFNVAQPLLDAMSGTLDNTRGLVGVRAGVWVPPVRSLSEPVDEVINYDGRSYPGYDTVTATYISATNDWQETEAQVPYQINTVGQREKNLPLELVSAPEQVARHMKISGERDKHNRTLSAMFDGKEWGSRIGERVTIDWPDYPRQHGTYVIKAYQPFLSVTADGRVQARVGLSLKEDAESIYAWAAGDYVDETETVDEGSTPKSIAAPAPLTLVCDQTTVISSGGVKQQRILAYWSPVTDAEKYQIRWSAPAFGSYPAESGSADVWPNDDGSGNVFYYIPVANADGRVYTVEVRASGDGSLSDWTSDTVAVAGISAVLPAPTFVSESHDNLQTRTIRLKTSTGSEVNGMRLYGSDVDDINTSYEADAITGIGPLTEYDLLDTHAFDGTNLYYWGVTLDVYGGESGTLALGPYAAPPGSNVGGRVTYLGENVVYTDTGEPVFYTGAYEAMP